MAKLIIPEYTVSLESQLERIALEENFLSNLSHLFKDAIPNLAVKISESTELFKSGLLDSKEVKQFKHISSDLKKKIKYANYANYSDMLVSVPEGFKGDLIQYIKTLNSMHKDVYASINNILGEYNFILSSFINSKEDKISLKDHTSLYKKATSERLHYIKQIDQYFNKSSDTSLAKLSMVIKRFADIDELTSQCVALETKRKDANLISISDSLSKCIDLLDIIHQNIKDDKIDNVSGAMTKNIAQGAYEIAQMVEFISVFKYRTEQATTSVYNALTKLDSMMV